MSSILYVGTNTGVETDNVIMMYYIAMSKYVADANSVDIVANMHA